MKTLLLTFISFILSASLVWAGCTLQVIHLPGKSIICQTCCDSNGFCQTTCN